MEWKNINNGESGLSVRAKINSAFNEIINGKEGIYKLWESITKLTKTLTQNREETDKEIKDLQRGVRKSQAYADKQSALTIQKVTKSLTEVQNATLRNKGYFSSVEALKQVWPTSEAGTIAYVGVLSPYAIYKWSEDGGWYDTGSTYNGEPATFEGYPKVGYVDDDGNVQLIDYEGNPVFPVIQPTEVFLSEEEYEALTEKDPDKLYFVFEEE